MHELSIAMSMIEIAVSHAQEANAKKINQIEIEIGELSGVVASALEFSFEAACRDTLAEGAELALTIVPAKAECENCKKQFSVDSLFAQCPQCQDLKVNVISGQELKIKSIIVD